MEPTESRCPTRFSIVQWTTGELSAAERAAIEVHLDRCAACQQTLSELKANIRSYPLDEEQLVSSCRASPAQQPAPRYRWSWLSPMRIAAPAALIATIILVAFLLPVKDSPPAPEYFSLRGAFSIRVIAKRGEQQFEVKANARLKPDDSLRFLVTTAEPGYLTIFALDQRNILSPYYPSTEAKDDPRPLLIKKVGQEVLPGSIVLDHTVGVEHIIVLFSKRPFNRRQVHSYIRRLLQRSGVQETLRATFQAGHLIKIITINKLAESSSPVQEHRPASHAP